MYFYSSLEAKYNNFVYPLVEIEVDGNSISQDKSNIGIARVSVELTAGFEASQAVFSLYNCYNYDSREFEFGIVKKYVLIGSQVTVYMGYEATTVEVFRGFITKSSFIMDEGDVPHVQVTAMDVKAVMMANRYQKMLKAKNYTDAVNEIFKQNVYTNLRSSGAIISYEIGRTPDKPLVSTDTGIKETDKMIEMSGESDYEFIVRAAKKYNFEFFVLGGRVYFRPAKCDTENQMSVDGKVSIKHLTVDYDVTGLVETVEVRGMDVGKGKLLKKEQKNSNKLSQGNKVKPLLDGTKFVYVDPTVQSVSDAADRAKSLMEDIMYRYGSLDLEMIGLPEIVPGKFIKIKNLGEAISNKFYVYRVRHNVSSKGEFTTRVIGVAAKQKGSI